MKQTNYLSVLTLLFSLFITVSTARAQCVLVVQSQVNASLAPTTCSYTLSVNDISLSSGCTPGTLIAQAYLGGVWVTSPTFNYSHVNQNFLVRVYQPTTGNAAWGYLRIEDKVPPVINCGAPLTRYCDQVCSIPFTPAVSDCDATLTISQSETVSNLPCTGTYANIITRTYTATDDGGNSSSCTKTINVLPRPATMVVFPPDITLQVTGSDCTPWCETGSMPPAAPFSNASLYATGVPTVNGIPVAPVKNPADGCANGCYARCGFSVYSVSDELPICGTNRIVNRNWLLYSACMATVSYTQKISIYTDGNTSCGQACSTPSGLSHLMLTASKVRLSWAIPAGCPKEYQLQYRFRSGTTWGAWTTVTTTSTNRNVIVPAGSNKGEFKVRTVCNGVHSSLSSSYTFTPVFLSGEADDRSEADSDTPPVVEADIQDTWDVWPNPGAGKFNIRLSQALSVETPIRIFTVDGRQVADHILPEGTTDAAYDLTSLPAGVYLMHLNTESGAMVKRIVLSK